MRGRKKIEEKNGGLPPEVARGIISVVCFTLAFFSLLALLDKAGEAGKMVKEVSGIILGVVRFALPAILLILGVFILAERKASDKILPALLLLLSLLGLLHIKVSLEPSLANLFSGGGYIGFLIVVIMKHIMGFIATLLILSALALISFIILLRVPLVFIFKQMVIWSVKAWQRLVSSLNKPLKGGERPKEEARSREIIEAPKEKLPVTSFQERSIAPTPIPQAVLPADLSLPPVSLPSFASYKIPFDLLEDFQETPVSGDVAATEIRIQETLEHFGIPVEMGEAEVGPTVTRYTFKPAEGIKLSRITALGPDLSLSLAAHPIRIEAPIPGKSLVGIEVPNRSVARVSLKEILTSKEWGERNSNLAIGLGRDVAGHIVLADLKKMPHLLLAGATGSGKTVALNSLIVSLIFANSPLMCRLLLIDPKRVELPLYNGIAHLIMPVVTEVKKTIQALRFAIAEMDRRFELFEEVGARDIASYNASQGPEKIIPYLVVVIDELADLMAVAASEVEGAIIRLAQMARATGIHLVVATQRPSVDVITGLIKANITSRVAFSVASSIDSRTIMDAAGAEKLLGRGDMLFLTPEFSKPRRIQGAFLKENEIKKIVSYIKEEVPQITESLNVAQSAPQVSLDDFQDDASVEDEDLYQQAKQVVLEMQKASATLLQRRLKIGYARAARILDLLEERGIVGKAEGAKPREVFGTSPQSPQAPETGGEAEIL
jgi:S-DNA-T family DNA segregation ATPase FtsK/SpoIIIE